MLSAASLSDELLTPEEAAQHLKINVKLVYRLEQSGSLVAVDLSVPGSLRRTLRFSAEEIARFKRQAQTTGGRRPAQRQGRGGARS